jgi:hypothetical protein
MVNLNFTLNKDILTALIENEIFCKEAGKYPCSLLRSSTVIWKKRKQDFVKIKKAKIIKKGIDKNHQKLLQQQVGAERDLI